MIVFAGSSSAGSLNDVWSLSLAGGTSWSPLSPTGTPPPVPMDHSVSVFDAPRDRMITYGNNGVWALGLVGTPAWTQISTTGTGPSGPEAPSGAYDPTRQRLLVAMGVGSSASYELELTGTPTWYPLFANPPSGRGYAGSVWDAANDRMLVVAGGHEGVGQFNDVQALAFPSSQLSLIVAAAPASGGTVQVDPSMNCFSPGAQVTLTAVPGAHSTFGGWSGDASGLTNPLTVTMDSAKNITANFVTYTLMTSSVPAAGGTITRNLDQPSYSPGQQVTLTATADPKYGFQGWLGDASGTTNPLTITMDSDKNISAQFLTYSLVVNATPAGTGTIAKNPDQTSYAPGSQVTLTALGSYSFVGWSGDASGLTNPLTITMDKSKNITGTFAPPSACGDWTTAANGSQSRAAAGAAWDPINHRVLRFGGFDGSNFLNDLWSFTIANGWVQLSPAGTPPSPRDAPGFLYDPVRSRMLLIYGNNNTPPTDVWQLSLSGTPTWSQIATAGTAPAGRAFFSTIYDPIRDRVIMFGGAQGSSTLNDVWSLSLAGTPTWTQLAPAGAPPAVRYGQVAIYDSLRDRMVVHGGSSSNNGGGTQGLSDTWALALSGTPTWTQLTPYGTPPQVYLGTGTYDPIRDRMLVLSGIGDGGGSIWSLSLKVQPAWFLIPAGGSGITARHYHSAVYEPDHDLVLAFNGQNTVNLYLTDTKRLDCAGGYWLETSGDHGTVNANPQKACYTAGASVSLSPQAQQNFAFTSWLGDATGNAQPLNLTMNGNKVVLAHFGSNHLNVTVVPSGSGTVTKNPDLIVYPAGTQVTLTASGSFPFVGWSGDITGNTNPITVTVNSDMNVTATFQAYTLNANGQPTGSGTVTKNPNLTLYAPGTQVTLSASGSFPFVNWSGDATGNTNPLTVTMDGNKNITANFLAYTLTTNGLPSGGGTVGRNPDLTLYPPGQVTLTATPSAGYAFGSWSGDATGSTDPLTLNMDANKTVTANFLGYPLNVSASPAAAGTVTKNPNQPIYPPGTQVTLTATASSSYTFIGWSGDATGTTNPLTVTIDAAKNITANFSAYTLTTNALPAGTGTVSRNPNLSLYPIGTQVTLIATPSAGYAFGSWSGDATGINNPLQLTMDANKNITANFVLPTPGCGNWTLVTTATQPRTAPGAAWDPVNHRVLRFGGQDATSFRNDLWSYTTAAGWVQLAPAGTPPSPRDAPGFLYDPVRGRMLVIAGNANVPPNDVWQLSLSGTPAWSQVATTGTPPSGRFGFTTIYDPVRDRVLLFGGYPFTNELWELALSGTPTWTKLTPAGTSPTARYGQVAIYDPVRDRMLVHGGSASSGILNDTWQLSLAGTPTWAPIAALGEAPSIALTSAVYDPIRDRMLVVSGYGSGTQANANAVWSLSLKVQPNWFRVPAGGTSLDTRYTHCAVYDPDDDLILAFNGLAPGGALLTDTKRLDCAGGYWLETGGDYGTVSESVLKACYGSGDVVTLTPQAQTDYAFQSWLGDASGNTQPLDVTMDANKVILGQFYNTLVGVEDSPVSFALGEIRPNPSHGEVELSYSLPHAARVRLAIYDVSGREVGVLADGEVQPGRHTVRWSGLVGGSAAKSGVYFVRYETPGRNFQSRLVLLR
jgi:uncharacterized repeat protein (TIGR02543 family)